MCALALVVSAGHAGEGHPVDAGAEAGKRSSQWFRSVPPGGTLRVVNPHGDVYARFGGYDDRAEILATHQRLETELPELEVRFEPSDRALELSVGFARPFVEPVETRDRVDLVVFVPREIALDVETRDGAIEVKKLQSDVTAATAAGDVTIRSVQGRVQAKSGRGDLAVTLATGATSEPQRLATETGALAVWLWEDADFDVHLRTSGEIATDFSLEIEHRRTEEPSKHAVAVVGRGGPRLELSSKQGNVRLLRLNRHFRPEP